MSTTIPNFLPALSLQTWLEGHSLAEIPPPEVQAAMKTWIKDRLERAQADLHRQIQQVHQEEEPKRPMITVQFSDGPGTLPDRQWVSPGEDQWRRRQADWEQQLKEWGDPKDWTWAEVVYRWEDVSSRELFFWELLLSDRMKALPKEGYKPQGQLASTRLKELTAIKPGASVAAWQQRWQELKNFSHHLDQKVLGHWARERAKEYEAMGDTVGWGDRWFNFMVGATIFADVYHSENHQEFQRRRDAYLRLADRITTTDMGAAFAQFRDLETDPQLAELLQIYQVDAAVQRYGVGTLLVILSALSAGYVTGALGLSEGTLVTLGTQSSRQLGLRLLAQSTTFVLTHRGLSSFVLDQPAFGSPGGNVTDRAWDLGEEILLTAAMFYFLGGTQEKFLQLGGKHWSPGLRDMGSFATEYGAFTTWQIFEGTYHHLGSGPEVLAESWEQALSQEAWLDRLVFLISLRLGGGAARGILQEIPKTPERNPKFYENWVPWEWRPAFGTEGMSLPGSVLMMSGRSGPKGPPPKGSGHRRPPEAKTLTDQRALNTLVNPGRLPPGDPTRLTPQRLEANAKRLSDWEPGPRPEVPPLGQEIDGFRITRDHWVQSPARWVRLFFDGEGRLQSLSEHPGREPKYRGVYPEPKGPGAPVDVLMDPHTKAVLWFDHHLAGNGAYLGGRPLDAMTALWHSGRGVRQGIPTSERMALAYRVAETLEPREWHRELLADFPEGPLLRDTLEVIYAAAPQGWSVQKLHLYRERGLVRLGTQVPPSATEHGKMELRVLREGFMDPVTEVRRGQLHAGSLSRETLQDYETVMQWLQVKLGDMPTMILPAEKTVLITPPPREISLPWWRRMSQSLRQGWKNLAPRASASQPPPATVPLSSRPQIQESFDGVKTLRLPSGTKTVLLGGRELARPDYPDTYVKITRLEDGTHLLEVLGDGRMILVNDLAVPPGRWVILFPGDVLTFSPEGVFRFSGLSL